MLCTAGVQVGPRWGTECQRSHVPATAGHGEVPGRKVPAFLYDSPGTLERGTRGHFRGKSTREKSVSLPLRTPIGWLALLENAKVPDSLERRLQLGTTSRWHRPTYSRERLKGQDFAEVVPSCND